MKEDDPVLLAYKEQRQYISAKNWGNEVEGLKQEYALPDEGVITGFSKEGWKTWVKKAIKKKAIEDLCKERSSMSKASDFPPEKHLQTKSYFFNLDYEHARILFRLRCQNLDIKAWHQYRYNDLECRLCGGTETADHVLRRCAMIRAEYVPSEVSVYTEDKTMQRKVAERGRMFIKQLEELMREG